MRVLAIDDLGQVLANAVIDAIAETDEDVTVVDGAAVQTTEESDTEDAIAEGS